MADPKVINYAGEQKIYNKEKVDELLDTKQDTLVPDIVVQDSVNVVTNSAVKAYVDAETQRAETAEGDLNDLNTTDKSNLVAAINEVKDSAYTVDEHVTAGSTNPVQNTGVKEYVDAQDEATLQSAKDYTDDKIGELEPGDGSTVVELTGHLGDLNNAAESLVTAINNIDGRVEQNSLGIGALETSLNQESTARIAGDQALDTKITQVEQAKQDKLTFDDTPTHSSNNPVTSTGIKDYVDEITGQLGDLNNAAESLVTAINQLDDRVGQNATSINDLNNNLAAELQARIDGDQALDTKITQVEQTKQNKLTFDDTPTHSSNNPVTSTGIKDYVDEITGQLNDLNTPAESLVTAINQLEGKFKDPDDAMSDTSENAVQNKVIKEYIDDKDTTPAEGSQKAVTSDGIYKAIKRSYVKVGDIMDWPQFKTETRTMVSDSPFEFTFNGLMHNVTVEPKDVEFEIADNVPEGWKAMDGTAVIDAADNQELADFFGGRNTTTDGKIWIPYLPRKIIKVAY